MTGGCDARYENDNCKRVIDSTELLTEGEASWVFTAPLPSARQMIKGGSIDNKIIITGAYGLNIEQYVVSCWRVISSRIIGWGIRFKLQMLCPLEDE